MNIRYQKNQVQTSKISLYLAVFLNCSVRIRTTNTLLTFSNGTDNNQKQSTAVINLL